MRRKRLQHTFREEKDPRRVVETPLVELAAYTNPYPTTSMTIRAAAWRIKMGMVLTT